MTRNHNNDASSSKNSKTSENNAPSSWSNLDKDLLFSIMMRLGIVDFFSFNRVCKYWRSFARSHRNKFMGSRQPVSVYFSTGTKKECYLEDFEERKFRTIIPHSNNSTCVGQTCGYLILFGRKSRDFWLVNPITRHELHFPGFPFYVSTDPKRIRAILVFSPSMSSWVFLISHKFSSIISFSFSGNWNYISTRFPIHDIHSFKGKIYTINTGSRLFEMRLDPKPTLTLLGLKNFPDPDLLRPEFVNSGEYLYVTNSILKDVYEAHEIDFDKMEWVNSEKTIGEFSIFVSDLKSSAAINPDTWVDPRIQYERFRYFNGTDRSKNKGRWFTTNMWYFPQDCLNVNYLL